MTWVLYAIEQDDVKTDDDGEFVPSLMARYDERGEGSPLIWESRDEAEQLLRDMARETGCYGTARVVELTLSSRFPDPYYCGNCDKWGSYAEHIAHDV